MTDEKRICDPRTNGDVHTFFGLSYSNSLVIHRSILQNMPHDWQYRFVVVMEELRDAVMDAERRGVLVMPEYYNVTARDENGKFIKDPVPQYDRGRTHIDMCPEVDDENPTKEEWANRPSYYSVRKVNDE